MVTEKQKNTIADALAETLHFAANSAARRRVRADRDTHYTIEIGRAGIVTISFAALRDGMDFTGWIALDT